MTPGVGAPRRAAPGRPLLAAVAASGAAVVSSAAHAARAAPLIVTLAGPPGLDSLRTVTPTFAVSVANVEAADRPVRLTLQISTTPGVVPPLLVDTTVVTESASITLTRPLPGGTTVYAHAVATTTMGEMFFSPPFGPRPIPVWVTLVSPNSPAGTTFSLRRPRFTWSALGVSAPPGPWRFEFRVINSATGSLAFSRLTMDTSIVLPVDLEVNTSYRWAIVARLSSGDSIVVMSRSSFVIADADTPRITLLYQNFPNPFPSATSSATCVWFDLSEAGKVTLSILDLRGNLVRTLLPQPGGPALMQAGRYGRIDPGGGCTSNLRWDGRDDRERLVPPGVYLLRLRARSVDSFRRIVFLGG